jgi:phosphodiesterase/alkaline phosphatase D-like protein
MKIRRITIEVEVPWKVSSDEVLSHLRVGSDELTEFIPYQAQVVKDELSPNKRIGFYQRFPCDEK